MKVYKRFLKKFSRFRYDQFRQTNVGVEMADPNECYKNSTTEYHDEDGQGGPSEDLTSEVRFK